MMRQHLETRDKYPDAILFFRLGDLYEMPWKDGVFLRTAPDMSC